MAHRSAPCRHPQALEALKQALDSERARTNHSAVVVWSRREAQLCAFIVAAQPDIITLQEVDHISELQQRLRTLGYECSLPGKEYRPAHEWADEAEEGKDASRFLAHLKDVGVAFVPKTKSNCRKFGKKDGRKDADDDGMGRSRCSELPLHLAPRATTYRAFLRRRHLLARRTDGGAED